MQTNRFLQYLGFWLLIIAIGLVSQSCQNRYADQDSSQHIYAALDSKSLLHEMNNTLAVDTLAKAQKDRLNLHVRALLLIVVISVTVLPNIRAS